MKNIIEILKAHGIEIPEDKETEITKEVADNYKSVAEFEKKISKLESEIEHEKERANTAEETLKGFEGKDFDAITKERDEWKSKAEKAHEEYEAKEKARAYSEAVENACKDLKFTSNSARKAFIADLEQEGLSIKDGSLLGFKDFVDSYKKNDESAFANEAEPESAKFTTPQSGTKPKSEVHDADLRSAFGLKPLD